MITPEQLRSARELAEGHGQDIGKLVIELDPQNPNELAIIVGSYMGGLQMTLQRLADQHNAVDTQEG